MECGVQQEVHSLLCSAEAYANEVANSYVKKPDTSHVGTVARQGVCTMARNWRATRKKHS